MKNMDDEPNVNAVEDAQERATTRLSSMNPLQSNGTMARFRPMSSETPSRHFPHFCAHGEDAIF